MARTKQTRRGKASRKQLASAPLSAPSSPISPKAVINIEDWSCNEEYHLPFTPTISRNSRKTKSRPKSRSKSNLKHTQIHQTQNKIVPFIKLARKISHCNPTQLQQFITEIINVFNKNDKYDVFQNILLNGLKSNYKSIPAVLYQQIDQIDSVEPQLIFNDSFPVMDDENQDDDSMAENKQDDVYNKNQAFLMKQLPKDILCYTFNFLDISDIFSISKTCRYLCVISYDPHSIYHLQIKGVVDFTHCSKDLRYSKIKSLKLTPYYDKQFNQIIGLWNRLECLIVPGCQQRLKSGYQNLKRRFPSVLDLKRFSLDLNYGYNELNESLIENQMNVKVLQYLSLTGLHVTFENIKLLMKFSNLKKLSLLNVEIVHPMGNESIQTEDFYKLLTGNTKFIGSSYPFPYLKHLETDSTWISDANIDILNWILMNGSHKKTLTLNFNRKITLGEDFKSRFMVSLSRVNELIFNISNEPSTHLLSLYDICSIKWNSFVLNSKVNINETKVQKMIDNIVQNSNNSSLIYETGDFGSFRKWLYEHYVSGENFFNGIHLSLINDVSLCNYKGDNCKQFNWREHTHDSDGEWEENDMPECLCIARENMKENISNEFEAIEWFLNRCDNKKKLKQIGIQSLSLNLIHKHKHDLKPRESLDYYDDYERNEWEQEDYAMKKEKEITDQRNKAIRDASEETVHQYLSNKFEQLCRRKKFEYDDNKDMFRFSHSIHFDSENV